MRVPIDRSDGAILIIAASLLVLLTAAAMLMGPRSGPSAGFPSTYSTASDGAKAGYLLLSALGYKVERWEQSPVDLPEQPENIVLILASPVVPPSSEERWRVGKFVSSGGHVLATGVSGASLVPEDNMQRTAHYHFDVRRFRAKLPGPIALRAPEVETRGLVRWGTQRPHHLIYYGDDEGGTVVAYSVGAGQVIWWADDFPLTNYGLSQASNLRLLLNSLGSPGETRVLWDEYFHGQRRGFASYLEGTPAPWMLVQFLIVFAAVIFTFSRRSGPVRSLTTRGTRLSPLEFIETLGDLYQRKGAATSALEIAYHRFRFLLLRRLGLPLAASAEEVQRGAFECLGERSPEFYKVLQRCERAVKGGALTESDALHLIGELHDYTRRWRLAGIRA